MCVITAVNTVNRSQEDSHWKQDMAVDLSQQAAFMLNVAGSGREDAASVVKRLLDMGVAPNIADASGFTALAGAARVGDADTVELLLSAGATADLATREKSNTPLFWAAARGHAHIVKQLIEASADHSHQNLQGDTPLLWACRSGAVAVAKELLAKEPTLTNDTNALGMTCLICASAGGHAEMCAWLLSRWAPLPSWIDSADVNGRTALHFAAGSGSSAKACVQVLLSHGANWRLRDSRGVTPLGEAQRAQNEDAAAILREVWAACEESQLVVQEGSTKGSTAKRSGRRRRKGREEGAGENGAAAHQPSAPAIADPPSYRESSDADLSDPPSLLEDDESLLATVPSMLSPHVSTEPLPTSDPMGGSEDELSGSVQSEASTACEDGGWVEVGRRSHNKTAPPARDTAKALPRPSEGVNESGHPGARAPPVKAHVRGGAAGNIVAAQASCSPTRRSCFKEALLGSANRAAGPPPRSKSHRDQPRRRQAALTDAVASASSYASSGCTSADVATDDPNSEGSGSESEEWLAFAARQPALIALDVRLKHMLGEGLFELSMAQLTELLAVQRKLAEQLEEARVSLAQRLEREVVEERMLQQFEEHLRKLQNKLP